MQLDVIHQAMRDLLVRKLRGETDLGPAVDEALNKCGNECCEQCGDIFCTWGEPLHFHHDGCPCCSMVPDGKWDYAKRDAALLLRNTRHD